METFLEDGRWTRQVREVILQGLSEQDAKHWPVQFSQKVETVKDFEVLYHSFAVGVLEVALPHDKYGLAKPVVDLHKDYKNASLEDWERVRAETMVLVKATAPALAADANRGLIKEADAVVMAVRAGIEGDVANSFAVANAGAVANAVANAAWVSPDDDALQKIRDAFLNADGGDDETDTAH
ncbi:hypothetical protein N9L75_03655 [Porticoccaceae bacterium]|nr:hypothetical protein [Porticoccaceae bacterium]MDA8651651.1 hypothetical protein [Porticoccaceae bacterium]MDA8682405.1 hypothetical protein [Porticoccaceae bacterium]MDB2664456.1 hypothetical protein [Porticoccaceae bacterium]